MGIGRGIFLSCLGVEGKKGISLLAAGVRLSLEGATSHPACRCTSVVTAPGNTHIGVLSLLPASVQDGGHADAWRGEEGTGCGEQGTDSRSRALAAGGGQWGGARSAVGMRA
jgi:hypothetical protein